MRYPYRLLTFITCLFTFQFAAENVRAQSDRAALTGTVTDATQAAVPGAHVRIVYPNIGLPIGSCYVEVGATGFQSLKTTTFALNVGETRTLDLTLEIATATTTVGVTDVSQALQQNNATVGDVLVAAQLNNCRSMVGTGSR
jgi:hypothetical protein